MLRKKWPTMFPFDRLDKSASLTNLKTLKLFNQLCLY